MIESPVSGAEPSACPLSLSDFPPGLQRSLDPASPLPVRTMAAKGLVPGAPSDILSALFFLTFDPDPTVAQVARQTAAKVNDRLHGGLRDDELPSAVLAFYAALLSEHEPLLELIALNQGAADETIAHLAATGSERLVEVIAQNQLRILRDERIVRALAENPRTRLATRDGVLDFCVRSGLHLPDLPAFIDARRRVLGDEADVRSAAEPDDTLEKLVEDFGESVLSEGVPLADEMRLTFTQRLMKMSVVQKIKLATLGNKEARTQLLRDSNKLVCLAAVQSPRITDGEIVSLSNSRVLHDEVMRYIVRNREWLKAYQVKLNLVNNPKCPVAVSLKLLHHLHPADVKAVARNRNISSTVQTQARLLVQKKEQRQ